MITIVDMSRKPTDQYKIQTPSIPELKDGLEIVAQRIARNVQFQGRKLRYGPMLNAIVAEFLRLPEDQQDSLVESGLRLFESLLESDEPRDEKVAPGTSPHAWLVAGSEEPAVHRDVAVGARSRRRDANPKRKDKATDSA